jgi:hypothetical protein
MALRERNPSTGCSWIGRISSSNGRTQAAPAARAELVIEDDHDGEAEDALRRTRSLTPDSFRHRGAGTPSSITDANPSSGKVSASAALGSDLSYPVALDPSLVGSGTPMS